ncbi:DNA adenine methylase [Pseudomonas plecoglossicida]|uniref:site-specific DNA-methyltransferase (adenine-specific) n=2 Tax=Pseudomonas TaxID=286 RepID=A0ABZ2J8D7_9PSED|nr:MULTISPECIES: DNA adenine methylase [Pseudomonas]MDQ7966542.1 DNA adenine methylase [Pseudomonas plecoglossicida]WBM48497.1 DNA adenine methylase [Pseudomonas putida]WFG04957.1 DNA adenine methylase [Pseudomonas putida]
MYAVSPLRYPGAKWRLEKFVNALLKANNLQGSDYVEPFAGGASLAISLLLQGYVGKIHLNDLDRSVYAFWHSVIHETEGLCRLISDTPVSMDVWRAQKMIQSEKGQAGLLELGFSTFFLNRTNRSGILSAGVIGGKEQAGKWKIDARYNKVNLISRVEAIAGKGSSVQVYNFDALEFLSICNQSLPASSFIYLDPPYFVKGQELYLNFYNSSDHARLSSFVQQELSLPWMVSYDDVEEIKQLYSLSYATEEPYLLPYSASKVRKGREVFFLGPGLKTQTDLIHTSTSKKRKMAPCS